MSLRDLAKSAAKGIATGLVVINLGSAALVYPLASRGASQAVIEDSLRTYAHGTFDPVFGPAGGEAFHWATYLGRKIVYVVYDN